jgi:hypothetical protein
MGAGSGRATLFVETGSIYEGNSLFFSSAVLIASNFVTPVKTDFAGQTID